MVPSIEGHGSCRQHNGQVKVVRDHKIYFLRDFEDEVVFVHCDLEQVDEILYEMPIKVENKYEIEMRDL